MSMRYAIATIYKYSRFELIAIAVTMVFAGVAVPVQTYVLKLLIDTAQSSDFVIVLTLFVGLNLLNLLNQYWRSYLEIDLERNLSRKFGDELIHIYTGLEFQSFESEEALNPIARFKEPAAIAVHSYHTILSIIQQTISFGGICILFLHASPILFTGTVVLFLFSLVFNMREIHEMRKLAYTQTTVERKSHYIAGLFLDRAAEKEIKVYNIAKYLLNMYDKTTTALIQERISVRRKGFWGGVFSQIIALLFSILGISFLVYLGYLQSIDISEVIALASTLPALVLMSSWTLPASAAEYFRYNALWRDYRRIRALPAIEKPAGDSGVSGKTIQFEDVYFRYPNAESDVLKGVNLSIEPGQNIALVGKNGCGKSTIIKLLLGLYPVDRGAIRVGGKLLSELDTETRQSLFTAVFQDFTVFDLSVRENIEISNLNDSGNAAKLNWVIEQTDFDEVMHSGKIDLDTNLGRIYPDGVSLSGGENQRLAITRALFSDSDYCIFDEPTASLDPVSEAGFYEMIRNNPVKKSLIMISHRLPSAKLADRIYFIDDGTVRESGSHEELMAHGGAYYQMFSEQSKWYKRDSGVAV